MNYKFLMKARNGRSVEYTILDGDDGLGAIFYHSKAQKRKSECSSISLAKFKAGVESGDIEILP